MGEKEWSPDSYFEIFTDSTVRQILTLAHGDPITAKELQTELNVSLPTIYRRLNTLTDHDLLTRYADVDSKGNELHRYQTAMEQLIYQIEDGNARIEIQLRHDLAGQFESLWEEFADSTPDVDSDGDSDHDSNSHRHDHPTGG